MCTHISWVLGVMIVMEVRSNTLVASYACQGGCMQGCEHGLVGVFALGGVGENYECVRVHGTLVGHVSSIGWGLA